MHLRDCDTPDSFGVFDVCDAYFKSVFGSIDPATSCLGCGAFGCVYAVGDRVLKITDDENETMAAYWVMKHQHPALPKIYDVLLLDETTCAMPKGTEPRFGILRENLADVPYMRAADELLVDDALRRIEHDAVNESQRHKKAIQDDIDALSSQLGLDIITTMRKLEQWARRKGFAFEDLKTQNLGMRGEQVVLRDFAQVEPRDFWKTSLA
jgi:hypothetical protein